MKLAFITAEGRIHSGGPATNARATEDWLRKECGWQNKEFAEVKRSLVLDKDRSKTRRRHRLAEFKRKFPK